MFSRNLKYLRTKQNYTQIFVANELGITKQALIQYEKGVSEPKLSVLNKIAAFYHLTIDLLVNTNLEQGVSKQENILSIGCTTKTKKSPVLLSCETKKSNEE